MQIGPLDDGNGLILYPKKDVSPSFDDAGKYCTQGQSGPVWFLTGTYKNAVDRNCTIRVGKAIHFTILNFECSLAEFSNLKTEGELGECAKLIQNSVIIWELAQDIKYNIVAE
jgi:hypothetical protein